LTSAQTFKLSPIPPGLPPEQQAQMQAFRGKLKPPPPTTEQFCINEKDQETKSMFDPANQPAGVCTETTISENGEAREVEDNCNIPLTQYAKLGLPRLPTIPVQVHRHILLTGNDAGIIDRFDVAMHKPRESLTQDFRWLAAECGAVKAPPRN
jgi:hypothetical protein